MTTSASTCVRQTCDGCPIKGKLMCVHTRKDLVEFWTLFMLFAIPFFTGMVLGKHWLGLAIWFGLAVLFFGYLEALLLCRHCPHYAEEGFLLRCHANAGLPKIPLFDPHPLKKIEKATWLISVAILFFWFVPFFLAGQQWWLLAITLGMTIAFAGILQRTKCHRCYNLSCPANRAPIEVRTAFFQSYPTFAQAWEIHTDE